MELGAVKKATNKSNLTLVPNTFISEPIRRYSNNTTAKTKQLINLDFSQPTYEQIEEPSASPALEVLQTPQVFSVSTNWLDKKTSFVGKEFSNKALFIGGAAALALLLLLGGKK